MNIIYLLIPLSLILVGFAVGAFFWAVRAGQFDDLHTPALKVLDDDGMPVAKGQDLQSNDQGSVANKPE